MAADLLRRATGHAMSCDASAIVAGGLDAELAIERISELERLWSRFLPTSEVTQINRNAGVATPVSRETIELVEQLVRGWQATGGAFDPTLVGALVTLGYGASRDDASLVTSLPSSTDPKGRPDRIEIDQRARTVTLPVGTAIDPGGLGKGLAADLICAELLQAGATGVLVELGGDVRVAGIPPVDDAWTLDVIDHVAPPPRRLMLAAGGVATSTTQRRRWQGHRGVRHHLVNPRTLDSCSTSVVTCTVVAGTAAWAEIFTKVAFVVGATEAIDTYEAHGLGALMSLDDGTEIATDAWMDFER